MFIKIVNECGGQYEDRYDIPIMAFHGMDEAKVQAQAENFAKEKAEHLKKVSDIYHKYDGDALTFNEIHYPDLDKKVKVLPEKPKHPCRDMSVIEDKEIRKSIEQKHLENLAAWQKACQPIEEYNQNVYDTLEKERDKFLDTKLNEYCNGDLKLINEVKGINWSEIDAMFKVRDIENTEVI